MHFHSQKGMKTKESPGPYPASKAPPELCIILFESILPFLSPQKTAILWLNSDKELITYQLLADGFRGAYGQIPSDF